MVICGIHFAHILCPRSEWHITMFSGFCLDIEKAGSTSEMCVTNNIRNSEGSMQKHINYFTMRVDRSNNILIATRGDTHVNCIIWLLEQFGKTCLVIA